MLIERAFRTRRPDDSHRARLRVEIGRLRALTKPLARIEATERGFKLTPKREPVVVLKAADRRRRGIVARAARRRRGVVHVGARARARHEPAHGAARARGARGGQARALDRACTRAALARAAARGIHDDLVTPCFAAGRLDCSHAATHKRREGETT